jgi:hypothetical protein
MFRRKPSKVNKLPPEIHSEVDRLLDAGESLEGISDWLKKQGYEISKSSVHRYSLDFRRRLDQIAAAVEPAKRIIEAIESGGFDLEDAERKMAQQLLVECLMRPAPDAVADLPDLINALVQIEKLALRREELRLKKLATEIKRQIAEKANNVADEVAKTAMEHGISEEAAEAIRANILGVAA